MINTILLDARNFDLVAPELIKVLENTGVCGIDCETHDANRHPGITAHCGYKPDGTRAKNGKLVFDMQRTVMTGYSIYPDNHDAAYYVNLNHADIENRVPWEKARTLLDAFNNRGTWISHNANYELTAFSTCYGYVLGDYVCTLQMAVSDHGPDEYDIGEFIKAGQGQIGYLIPSLLRLSQTWEPGTPMPADLEEMAGKVISKESKAAHSYNGLVKSVAYGYGLKQLVKRFFDYQMTTFEGVLSDEDISDDEDDEETPTRSGPAHHMGELTGAEVAKYGAEDAYWAVRLFRHLLEKMAAENPEVISTFIEQENPMIRVFSEVWAEGLPVKTANIYARRDVERVTMAATLRKLKAAVRECLPFPEAMCVGLKDEKWYKPKYREQIAAWAALPDNDDDYTQCQQVRGPVSNAWAKERGRPESSGPNFSHFMPVRVLMYDLLGAKVMRVKGKVQSNGEARGKLLDKMPGNPVLEALNAIAGVEQRMKLYLTPYLRLTDPDTNRMYPILSSMLASRRMASAAPNGMQLGKRGESVYVRGFFEADTDEHVNVSVDWSGIELVEIGEFSGDPEFIKAFGQIPHQDLHGGAAADILSVDINGLNEELFSLTKKFEHRDDYQREVGTQITNYNRLFTDLKGQELPIGKVFKYWRTELGKTSNFGYWYSGALSTTAERMGWSSDKMWEATERYRTRFPVAEHWRTSLIAEGQRKGFVTLPDHHRRVRFEATPFWKDLFKQTFHIAGADSYNAVVEYMAKRIQSRANNQLVNSYIQGTCATIAKRSIIRILKKARARGWGKDVFRFLMPIHDELVFTVHRSIAVEAIKLIRDTMIDHPDLFKLCQLDASPSVGLTFEPWTEKVTTGQVELFELPDIGLGNVGGRANDDQMAGVIDYLFSQQEMALAA